MGRSASFEFDLTQHVFCYLLRAHLVVTRLGGNCFFLDGFVCFGSTLLTCIFVAISLFGFRYLAILDRFELSARQQATPISFCASWVVGKTGRSMDETTAGAESYPKEKVGSTLFATNRAQDRSRDGKI